MLLKDAFSSELGREEKSLIWLSSFSTSDQTFEVFKDDLSCLVASEVGVFTGTEL